MRQLGVLALIAILVAALFAAYIGTHQQKLPAPFGPAVNGLIAYSKDGDIYTVDPSSGKQTLLLGGSSQDEWIGFTPDGTHAIFFRVDPGGATEDMGHVGTVAMSGDSSVVIGALPVSRDSWVEAAPDGRTLAIQSIVAGHMHVSLAAIDGSSVRTIDQPLSARFGGLAYIAPDGHELLFIAIIPQTARHKLVALDTTTGTTRDIVTDTTAAQLWGNFSASPDGKQIAYAVRDPRDGNVKVRLIGTDASNGSQLTSNTSPFEAWPQWSPDGHHLLIERMESDGSGRVHPVIVDTRDGTEVRIGVTISENGAGKTWSPDGTHILAQRTAGTGEQLRQELWDVATGAVSEVSWPSTSAPAWQRVAQ
jgi:Tol biopolymer transport system component